MLRQKGKCGESKSLLGKYSDDDDGEETELFVKKSPRKEIPTVEKLVEDGDTLQAISIRYHCSIAELKRLNNIHKENEIFAKRTIKVPASLFSMALVHHSGSSSPKLHDIVASKEVDGGLLEDKLKATIVDPLRSTTSAFNSEVNALIFNSNITSNKYCDSIIDDVNGEDLYHGADNDEEVQLMPNEIKTVEPVGTRITCSGADADISWIALVICISIVIFAIPLVYVLYIAEHPNHPHKEDNVTVISKE